MAAHSGLNAWLIPAKAHDEWLRLTAVVDELADEDVPCRADPAAWWVEKGVGTADPVAACRACPARQECLEYALAADERYGIWGATLPAERKAKRFPI